MPRLNGLLSRRQVKHEQAADRAELRLVDQRLRALEAWQGEARPQFGQVSNHVHVLMGEHGARQGQATPPCTGGPVSINGGCWEKVELWIRDCGSVGYVHEGGCYVPAKTPHARVPPG
ncbi:hypothetical protein [Myxococcus sp. AS-1-15]|uniref:hypothetical protein n=1 Tax=Myxococcus sp. AS-1-15 TaxID=2874600 RepID=UPI001CC11F02|nr:hypothetical protein [Myxococcus sp. AS-1-15]BDT34983.1 hypothetical protein MFMH1_46520 [Myxococcus sp. MH1]